MTLPIREACIPPFQKIGSVGDVTSMRIDLLNRSYVPNLDYYAALSTDISIINGRDKRDALIELYANKVLYNWSECLILRINSGGQILPNKQIIRVIDDEREYFIDKEAVLVSTESFQLLIGEPSNLQIQPVLPGEIVKFDASLLHEASINPDPEPMYMILTTRFIENWVSSIILTDSRDYSDNKEMPAIKRAGVVEDILEFEKFLASLNYSADTYYSSEKREVAYFENKVIFPDNNYRNPILQSAQENEIISKYLDKILPNKSKQRICIIAHYLPGGRIKKHRDATGFNKQSISVSTLDNVFILGDKKYKIKAGEIIKFNGKIPHEALANKEERFAIFAWYWND